MEFGRMRISAGRKFPRGIAFQPPHRSWHIKPQALWRGFAAVLLCVLLGSLAAQVVLAVHDDGLFQLDYATAPTAQGVANVSSTNTSPSSNTGDDWDKVYAGTSSAFATAFIEDTVGTAETSFYTGGGSKDERPISTGNQHWEWNNTNDVIPDKDDISHAFAAAYVEPGSGHTIFYFGADRFDTSGDAEIGFWFFRQRVTLGTKPNFNGEHEVGDILVLANWGGSNKVGDIAVYEWVGGNNPLTLLKDTTQADCSAAPANDPVCAVVNNQAGETPPWSYTNKDGQHSYKATALFEGGIDVNDLLGVQEIGCFSTFLAATRASHSTTAQLKDFALGAFPVCGIKVTKTGDALSKIGDPVDYTITIENTGRATLYKRNISDTLLGAITTNGVDQSNTYVLANTCSASLAPDASCTITLRRTVQAGDPDPLPNTASILYSEKSDFTGLEFTASDDHTVNLFQPAVTIDKSGDSLSKETDAANYTFTITNMSSEDSPNLTLASISDNVIGDLLSQATAAGCDVLIYNEVCSFSVSRTVLSGDPDPLVNTVNVLYHPVGFPNNITASDGHSVNLFQPSVSIEKSGDALSKIGDDVTYHFKITNTSSNDSPNLILDSISDDVLGNLASYASGCTSLAPGAVCEFDVPWTVAAVDLHPADGQADDPVINTVAIHFHPENFPNDISATGSHELNLFQPSIAFAKTADTELSKATDDVNYTLTLNNTSSADAPDLVCTITDAKLGVNKTVTLAAGDGDVTNVAYTVQAGDPDPLVNTASVSCSPTGFPNVLSATSSWSINLFQPQVKIEKSGDALSKIGDSVTYHFKITNLSSADSPNLMLDSISDSILGLLTAPSECDDLASNASCAFDVPWTVAVGSPDPVVNTVEVHYHPVNFPNDIVATDSHELNLFQPSVTLTKSGPAYSKASDTATYNITINNTSSGDSPNLVLNSFSDSVVAGVTPPSACNALAAGTSCSFSYTYVVQTGDPDPLVNTATVHYHPDGFPNDITAASSATTDLLHPSFTVSKTCKAEPISQVGPAIFTITFNNTGDADLHVVPSEGGTFDVAVGQSHSYDYSVNGPFAATVNNTVTGDVTLATKYGLSNSYSFTESASCTVKGKVKVAKTVSGQPPAAGQSFIFELRQGASTSADGTLLESKNTDAAGNISFSTELTPGQTYQICEWVFPGWNTTLVGDGALFVPNSITPPALPNPNVNNLTVCADFTVTSGQTRTFTVDNTPPPGGRALTIGFWKNWASCSNSNGKGQKPILDQTLAAAHVIGDATDGHNTLPGIVLAATGGSYWQFGPTYYLVIHGSTATPNVAPDCQKAVRLLDKSRIDNGKKMASDPAFNLAAQLLAAELNFNAGAGQNPTVITAVNQAVLLLGKYQFNGITHTTISKADATTMNSLATTLDDYNNNRGVQAATSEAAPSINIFLPVAASH